MVTYLINNNQKAYKVSWKCGTSYGSLPGLDSATNCYPRNRLIFRLLL